MTPALRATSVGAGVALALVALGVPLLLMMLPAYTSALVVRVDAPALADLDVGQARDRAEEVRAFVAGVPDATLPTSLDDGRPAFDESAISHLDDVRVVLDGARVATLAAALAAAAWIAWTLRARRQRALAFSLILGAWSVTALVALATVVAITDFDDFFAGFHALFFEAGTWQFPADALLIQLFPEPFWAISGAAWGTLALAGGLLLGILGRRVRTRFEGDQE
jgi:integral membrane protein (TIGR01906 family)